VASQAEIVSVKVLSSNGRGATSSIVQGVEWAIQHRKGKGAAVFSVSLGGRPSTALDTTVQRANDAGHIVVVAAGNDANDACRFSPARLGGNASAGFGVITVAATDKWDHRPGYSNYGHCVDLFAPGTSIVSASHEGQGSKSLTGTSMSAPHVAGVAATLLEKHGGSKTAAIKEMFEIASRGRVEGALKETPNILVQAPQISLITLPPVTITPPVCDFGRRKCKRRKKCRWSKNPATRKNECIDRYGTRFPTPSPTLRPSRSPVTPRPSRAPTPYPTRRPRG
jgi:subtilisin family serine protease